jgi:hypothetical protein
MNNVFAINWPRRLAALLLICVALFNAAKLEYFSLDASSIALILIGAFLGFIPLEDLIPRLHTLKATSKGVELVLEKLEQQAPQASGSRTELSGLSSHDIWALDTFANQKISLIVDQMNPAQRVAARTLADFKLLTIISEGTNRRVELTSLGRQILQAANSIL